MKFQNVPVGGSENYIRLKDGDKIKGIFRGEPRLFRQHWGQGFSTECTGPSCESCKAKVRSAFRFRVNFIAKEESGYTAKIFEGGAKIYNQLKTINEEYDVENHIVTISRTGSTMNDTTYSIMPAPNGIVTKEIMAKLENVKLHDLGSEVKEEEMGQMPDDEVPF